MTGWISHCIEWIAVTRLLLYVRHSDVFTAQWDPFLLFSIYMTSLTKSICWAENSPVGASGTLVMNRWGWAFKRFGFLVVGVTCTTGHSVPWGFLNGTGVASVCVRFSEVVFGSAASFFVCQYKLRGRGLCAWHFGGGVACLTSWGWSTLCASVSVEKAWPLSHP